MTRWSQAISSRPLRNWMPCPGPVAYHDQSRCFTAPVISRGSLQVAPSSPLEVTHTVSGAMSAEISGSSPSIRLRQNSSQMVPVSRSCTAAGLPLTQPSAVATTWVSPKLLPPSKLRRRNRSIWSVSRPVNLRASLKARMVPRSVVSRAGMRHSW